MKLTRRVAPPGLPVTQAEILAHLRILDSNPPDLADILRIAHGCVAEIQNRLRRALAPQAWSAWLDCFQDCIKIPLPPLIEVEEIRYLDTDMTLQILDTELYRVVDGGEDRSEIVLAPSQSWPVPAHTASCIEIKFIAGYADEGSPPERTLPADIVNAILELIAFRYVCRDGSMFSTDRILDELPAGRALQRYRVYA